MLSVNKVILIGTLADEPVVRDVEGECKMVGLSLFTLRRCYDASSGERQEDKEWHQVVIVDERLTGYAETQLAKDDQVYLEGELQTMRWRDDTYTWRSLTRIILWREGDQLRRVTDQDCGEPAAAFRTLAAVRDARVTSDPPEDSLVGCVA